MIEEVEDYHEWTEEKIKENEEQIEKLGNQRCQEVKLWLDTMAHNNLALDMIEFLQQAIENAKESEFVSQTSFLQLAKLIGFYRNK